MTSAGRRRDLADVLQLIRVLRLRSDFSEQLHPYVREQFSELHAALVVRYAALLDEVDSRLEAMVRDGAEVDTRVPRQDGRVKVVTTDPTIAERYDMAPESELWDDA